MTKNSIAEIQKTFWFEMARVAHFFQWKWLSSKCENKTIIRIYFDGKLKEEIKYNLKLK